MRKIILIIMILNVFAKMFGFIREIILAYYYGASNVSDAYIISITIPTVIFAFIGAGIVTSYIPIYNDVLKERGIQSADKFTSNIINFLLFICTFIVILVLFFSKPIVKLFASGFDVETLKLTVKFTNITIFAIYLSTLVYVFKGYLNSRNKFVIPALMGIPLNIFIIMSIIFSSKYSINILPICQVIAMMLQVLFLIIFVYREGYKHSFVLNKKDKYLKKMYYLSIPTILGSSVNQVNVLVDRTIASLVAVGGISALNYANKVNVFIQEIFVMSIATVLYPMISKMASNMEILELKNVLIEAIIAMSLLIIPITVGMMIFAEPLVRVLFGRGAFDYSAIKMTYHALFFYSIGMIGYGFREILSRVFYSLQDTKTPMINAGVAMIINIILNIILSKFLGIGGLALATSISAILCTILLYISLKKKIGLFGMINICILFLKILLASLIMGLISKVSFSYLTSSFGKNISLFIAIVIGVISYSIIIYFMKIKYVDVIITGIKKKLAKVFI